MNLKREYHFIGIDDEYAKKALTDICNGKVESLRNLYSGATDTFMFFGYAPDFYKFEKVEKLDSNIDNQSLLRANLALNKENIIYNALTEHLLYYKYDESIDKILNSPYAANLTKRDCLKKVEEPTVEKVLDILVSEQASYLAECSDEEQKAGKNKLTDLLQTIQKNVENKPLISLHQYDVDMSYSKSIQEDIYDLCNDIAIEVDEGLEIADFVENKLPTSADEINEAFASLKDEMSFVLACGFDSHDPDDLVTDAYRNALSDAVYKNENIIYYNRFANAINKLDESEKNRVELAFQNSDDSLVTYIELYVDNNLDNISGCRISTNDFLDELNNHCQELLNENSHDLNNSDEHTPKM